MTPPAISTVYGAIAMSMPGNQTKSLNGDTYHRVDDGDSDDGISSFDYSYLFIWLSSFVGKKRSYDKLYFGPGYFFVRSPLFIHLLELVCRGKKIVWLYFGPGSDEVCYYAVANYRHGPSFVKENDFRFPNFSRDGTSTPKIGVIRVRFVPECSSKRISIWRYGNYFKL